MFIFLSQPQMYSVFCKNKEIGLAVPILLGGLYEQNIGAILYEYSEKKRILNH